MRIAIDAHALGTRVPQGGNDVYWENLIRTLSRIDRADDYYILVGGHTHLMDELEGMRNFHFLTVKSIAAYRIVVGLAKMVDHYRIDLLHTNYFLPIGARCRTVVTIHDMAYFALRNYYRGVRFLAIRNMVRNSAKRASAILTVSHFSKNEIIRYLQVPSDKIHVVYNGLDHLRRGMPDPLYDSRTGMIPALAFPERFILTVGNIEPKKNLGVLVKGFKELLAFDNGDLSLIIVGSNTGKYVYRLKKLVRSLGLEGKVFFPGRVTDREFDEFLRRAMLFVYPSRYEGFGFPPFEAINAGVASVVARSSALPEILGENAAYFEPDDPHHLASLMHYMLADSSRRAALASRGSSLLHKFTWGESARRVLEVYKEIDKGKESARELG